MLNVTNLTKTFPGEAGPVKVLDGVDLTLAAGETLALTGESGSGKSTLLHVVAGLESADEGRVQIDGTDLLAQGDEARAKLRRETFGIVFQQFNLIPSLSVAQNLAFQARLAGRDDPAWITALAARLGLSDHLHKFPEELSGGQQQRVAIGRAIAPKPALLLADEPTGNLDEDTGDAVMELMLELVQETGAALLMVTHSARRADQVSRRVHLSHGRLQ